MLLLSSSSASLPSLRQLCKLLHLAVAVLVTPTLIVKHLARPACPAIATRPALRILVKAHSSLRHSMCAPPSTPQLVVQLVRWYDSHRRACLHGPNMSFKTAQITMLSSIASSDPVVCAKLYYCDNMKQSPFATVANNDVISAAFPSSDLDNWLLMFTQVIPGGLMAPFLQATLTTVPGQQPSWSFMLSFSR